MNRKLVLAVVVRLIVPVAAVLLALDGGWSLLWLLIVPISAWDIFRMVRPVPAGQVPARFGEAGQHRVVLQVPGPNAVRVLRELRRTRGLSLIEAKQMIDAAPVVVAEGLSEQSAELVADRLRAAGARALAAPIGEM